MKKFFLYLAFALLFLIIKNTLLHAVFPRLLIPDVILIMVFYLGFYRISVEGALTAFALGYLSDVFSGGIIGISSFTLVLTFIITSMLSKIVSLNSMLIKSGGAVFASILNGIMTYIFLRFLNDGIPFYTIFLTAVSTGIASPFIIALLQKAESYIAPYKREGKIID